MPFHDFPVKFVMIFASLLAHHTLEVQCASVGIVPNATIQAPAPTPLSPTNPSAPQTMDKASSPEHDASKLINCTESSVNGKICDLYNSLMAGLNQKWSANVTAVEKVDAEGFCANLSSLLSAVIGANPNRFERSPLEKRVFCDKWCVTLVGDTLEEHVQPICKVILWAAQKEQTLAKMKSETDDAQEIEETDSVNVKPVESSSAAIQPIMTAPGATAAKDSNSKTTEKEKQNSAETAAVSGPSVAISEDLPASQPAAASTPTKLVVTPKDDEDSLNDPEEQNNKNLNGIDAENRPFENSNENDDSDDAFGADEEALKNFKEATDNVGMENSFDEEKPFPNLPSGGSHDAVSIERVDPFFEQDDSNFFSYFLFMMFVCILCYVVYHNKSKLLALALEGRRTSSGRGGFSKGRKHTAAYRKLDSNLEEAITSNTAAGSRSTNQIIY